MGRWAEPSLTGKPYQYQDWQSEQRSGDKEIFIPIRIDELTAEAGNEFGQQQHDLAE